jgi:virginiamycin B lyase
MTGSTPNRNGRTRRRPADRGRARPRLEGLEDRCLLAPTITEFPVPATNAGPYDITAGPVGNLWFTDGGTGSIGMINPTNDTINEFPVPTPHGPPHAITAGPDGNLWFTETLANNLGMINPATHAITQFAVPTAKRNGSSQQFGITAGSDGNLWFTEPTAGRIGMINPATHTITQFAVPTGPNGICVGPDGNVWFTGGSEIGMINLATHAITEFATTSATTRITAGPDGNVWFTELSGKIGMIDLTHNYAVSEFPVPTAGAGPGAISAAPDGNLWFTEGIGNVATINPATHAITEYPIPYANAYPIGITAGPDGNVWFADRGNGSIGVVTLNPTSSMHLVVTQQPPSSVTAGSGFGLTLQAEDSSNNPVTSFNGTVTVGLATSPGGTTLGGTVTVAASGGVATFSGLTLTQVASGYTLYVSSSGPTSTTTNPFNVISSATSSALAAPSTATTPNPLLAPLVLDSPDLWDGLGFKKRPRSV